MSEKNLRVTERGSDQHPGVDDGQEKKAPVRKSSLVTVKNPMKKTFFVSFDENRTTIRTQDATEDNKAEKDTKNGCTKHSSKKAPDDGRSVFVFKSSK